MNKPLYEMNLAELWQYASTLRQELATVTDDLKKEKLEIALSEVEYEIRAYGTGSMYDENGIYHGPEGEGE